MMTKLPIDSYLESICEKILADKPVILTASPGSGKTTRVPVALLRHWQRKETGPCSIIVIVPKRISALSAAHRVCEENQITLGEDVGYIVRFESKVSRGTKVIYMTDGMFIKKLGDPNFLSTVTHVFFDEFHERRANMDLLLGLCYEKKILTGAPQIIVMSATLDSQFLQKYFNESRHVDISAPPFKLTTVYQKQTQRLTCDETFYDNLKAALLTALNRSSQDVLVFLPGAREIRRAEQMARASFPHVRVDILHGSLGIEGQRAIVQKKDSARRIILTTNVAESSLTIPGVDAVVDSGLEKKNSREKKMGFSKLEIQRISQFSARQREGRAARTQDGFVFKLWHHTDERSMSTVIKPEILESSLHTEILFLAVQDVQNFAGFSWLSPPSAKQIESAQKQLRDWKLLDAQNKPSPLGRKVLASPLDIENSILFIELVLRGYIDAAVDFVARLENLEDVDLGGTYADDFERIMAAPFTEPGRKLRQQLLGFARELKNESVTKNQPLRDDGKDDFVSEIFKIMAIYFPHRIVAKKRGSSGLSASGRGVELSAKSASQASDFYVALQGYEKSDAVTLVNSALGVTKARALEILAEHCQTVENIFFDDENGRFFKQESLNYGAFKLNEKSKTPLTQNEIESKWKSFAAANPREFLNLNPTFERLEKHLGFLRERAENFAIEKNAFNFEPGLPSQILNRVASLIHSFEEFKSINLIYYVDEVLPPRIISLLQQMPVDWRLASGKVVTVDYADPKAPMISGKIQDFFGWKKTPAFLNGEVKLTIQLLAPNMRPTQITQDLELFWKNSYLEIRKELKARYPKHAWPEFP